VDEREKALTELQKIPGVGGARAEALYNAGFTGLGSLAVATPDELEAANIGYDLAVNIIEAAKKILGIDEYKVIKAKDYASWRVGQPTLTTGCKALDDLLTPPAFIRAGKSGLEPGAIYEFVGPAGSGKTQLCHQLSVTAQLSTNKGGVGGRVLYIDTENTFRPERVEDVAARFKLENPLEGISLMRPRTSTALLSIVKRMVPEALARGEYKLVIIDSLIAHFRSEYPGRERLAARQQAISSLLGKLQIAVSSTNAYCAVTNEVEAVPAIGVGMQPAGGHVLAHATTHRVMLQALKERYMAEVTDSPCLPHAKAFFNVTNMGVVDLAEGK